MTERLLTARQVAGRLGVSPETVLRWTRRGQLPGIRLPGGALRFRQDDLVAWLDAHTTTRRRSPRPPGQEAPMIIIRPTGRDA